MSNKQVDLPQQKKFFPKGAIAFLVFLHISAAVLWFSLYAVFLNK